MVGASGLVATDFSVLSVLVSARRGYDCDYEYAEHCFYFQCFGRFFICDSPITVLALARHWCLWLSLLPLLHYSCVHIYNGTNYFFSLSLFFHPSVSLFLASPLSLSSFGSSTLYSVANWHYPSPEITSNMLYSRSLLLFIFSSHLPFFVCPTCAPVPGESVTHPRGIKGNGTALFAAP